MDETRTEYLPRTLTDEDVALRADDLARVLGEIDREEAEKALAAKDAAGRIAKLKGSPNQLAREIRDRKIYVEVEVEAVRNLEAGTIDTVREDTGEVIRTRPMTAEERQVSIDDHPSRRKARERADEAADRLVAAGEVTFTGTGDHPIVAAVVDAVAKANERKRRKKGDEASA